VSVAVGVVVSVGVGVAVPVAVGVGVGSSGCQLGQQSYAGLLVSLVWPLPSAFIT
jgi:hypothetical protein